MTSYQGSIEAGTSAGTSKPLSALENMTTIDLKQELGRLKLKKSGNKADLVSRLQTALRLEAEREDESEGDTDVTNDEDHDITVQSGRQMKKVSVRETLLTFRDVEETIPFFTGDDGISIHRWLEEFEDISALCEWTSVQKIIYAKRLLKGSAKIFMRHEKCDRSWPSFRRALREEFSETVNSGTIHRKLMERKKKRDETYQEYVYGMLDIANQASVETDAVIQYIIDGIEDEETNKTILYGARNIRELKEKFKIYETMKRNAKTRARYTGEKKMPVQSQKTSSGIRRCFTCGSRNHQSVECPTKDKGVKCFKCQEYGYFASKCTVKVPVNVCNVMEQRKKTEKEVFIASKRITALIDTGSDLSLIRAEQYVQVGAPRLKKNTMSFRGIGASESSTLGEFTTDIEIDGKTYSITLHVVSDTLMPYGLLIGTDFLNKVEFRMKNGDITIYENERESTVPEVFHISTCENNSELDLSYISNSDHRKRIEELKEKYTPNKIRELDMKMNIALTDDIPVYQRPRRLSPSEKNEVNTQINEWLENQIIQESQSNYASPIVLVKKKNGSTRLCIDYRKLNEKIIKDRYPLPLIEDHLDRLQDARIFSTLDLKNGFFHVEMEKNSRKYTAFVTPDGQYEFLRVPFGLCNSPSVFQRYINAIFKELIAKGFVLIYMDDLIVPSSDCVEGLHKLEIVLKTASEYGLMINWEKCQFIQTRIEYLGYVIENGTIRLSDHKTTAVMKFPKPSNIKSVQSFLGLTGYFRKFIPRYSIVARPLTNLLKKGTSFYFGLEEERAFNSLKLLLSSQPVLKLYNIKAETQLHTDASSFGCGAIIMQRDNKDNAFHPTYYASWKNSTSEGKYTSYELEVLAIIKALRKFRVYLLGISFKIITDCQAFALTMRKRDLCVRVARWVLLLGEFNYIVEHRPGKHMCHVDALSRHPTPMVLLVTGLENSVLSNIKRAQNEDSEIRGIISAVNQREVEGFIFENGILYKCAQNDAFIVVPKCLQVQIVRQAHERGHFGVIKTEAIIKKDYWFRDMRSKVEKVVRNCVQCILAERKVGKQEGFLHCIEKGTLPLDTYHLDHLGPITATKKKYRHIFVIVDAFTKFVWLYPTRSTDTAEVLDKLKKQAAIFGNPRRIITDRGTAFTSHSFENYCKDENIQHVLVTTAVPRGNGQVERVNRTLIPLLTKLTSPKPEDWYKHLDKAQTYLNYTPSRSTGEAPFKILFGTSMKIKEDPEMRKLIEEEWLAEFEENRNEIREKAKENILKVQAANRRNFNKRRKEAIKYRVGDLVAIKRMQPITHGKFSAKFFGPYAVQNVLRNDRYLVEKDGEGEGPQRTSTSADNMKPWVTFDEENVESHGENEEEDEVLFEDNI